MTSGRFQEAGFLVALNESALTVALAIGAGVSLCELDRELALSLLMHGRTLVENTGSIGPTSVDEAMASQRERVVQRLSSEEMSRRNAAPQLSD